LWVGELYFELHRGTYTTHARNKLGNRKSEFLLGNLEILGVMAGSYPQEELERLWKLTLLNQFHDVLPGTSIGLVYRDSDVHYKDIEESATKLIHKALDSLVGPEPTVAARSKTQVAVANTLAWSRSGVVELPEGVESSQTSSAGQGLALVTASGLSTNASVEIKPIKNAASLVHDASGTTLENSLIRAKFDASGKLVSVVHKPSGRESIEAGKEANKFLLYDDVPFFWDAWDVEIYHTEKPCTMAGIQSFKPLDKGPARASVELHYKISEHSHIKQVISLDAESDQLVFDTTVDWNENRKFLKVEFPVDVYATQAAFSTQFGWQSRPTHRNTSWDMAKFEVCAHHWADLNEFGFGVALLNDSKYGYSCLGNVLTLSLLRSSKMPDETADVGHQHFKYALLPHSGSHVDANLVRRGYEFNQPLLVRATASAAPSAALDAFFSIDKASIVLETVKRPESKAESTSVIVRIWEGLGGRGTVNVQSKKLFSKVFLCNLMEENESELKVEKVPDDGSIVAVPYKPFQIITLKFVF
jgi:alpha-mannosidase